MDQHRQHRGMSVGDVYELHYRRDPWFHGVRLGRALGEEVWSGKRLGLKRAGAGGWASISRDPSAAVRPQAIASSTIADDSVEDEHGMLIFAGRTIAELIASQLAARDYAPSKPENMGFKGWLFTVSSRRNVIVIRVSVVDDVYVAAYYHPNFSDRLLGRKDEIYRPLLRDLDAILRADDRFSNIRWMAAGAEGPEFEHPID